MYLCYIALYTYIYAYSRKCCCNKKNISKQNNFRDQGSQSQKFQPIKTGRESLESVHFLVARKQRQEEGPGRNGLPSEEPLSCLCSIRASSLLVGTAHIKGGSSALTLWKPHRFTNLPGSFQFNQVDSHYQPSYHPSQEGYIRDHAARALACDPLKRVMEETTVWSFPNSLLFNN